MLSPLRLPFLCVLAVVAVAQEDRDRTPPIFLELVGRRAPPGGEVFSVPVRFALPMPRGRWQNLPTVRISNRPVDRVQVHRVWPDGSIRVGLVEGLVDFDPRSRLQMHRVVLGRCEDAVSERVRHPLLDTIGSRALQVEVEDPWNRPYRAWLDFAQTEDPSVAEARASLVGESGAHFLTVRANLQLQASEFESAVLSVEIENRGLGPEGVLGPVRLSSCKLRSAANVRLVPRYARYSGLSDARVAADPKSGRWTHSLLVRDSGAYLGDRTGRVWRFDLALANAEGVERIRQRVAAGVAARIDVDTWRRTKAFGAFGGPAPRLGSDDPRARRHIDTWRTHASFGPFGNFGDPADANAAGWARNGPSALHDLLRWDSAEGWWIAESMVLQQTLRPIGFPYEPRLPETTEPLRQGISAAALEVPHGFSPAGYEHTTFDLLADWDLLTGDPVAYRLLRRAADAIPRLLTAVETRTGRGEGLCLQAGVRVAAALSGRGDPAGAALIDKLHRHVVVDLVPLLNLSDDQLCVLLQPAHPDAFGGVQRFDAPWQMAWLAQGVGALYRETGDPALADLVVAIVSKMTNSRLWPHGELPVELVSEQGLVEPWREGSWIGARTMLPALVLGARWCANKDRAARWDRLAGSLAASGLPRLRAASSNTWRFGIDRWEQLWIDRAVRLELVGRPK